ncbi:MAG: hypothetical protein ACWA41_06405 [Putridiphycobacter sp.]
MMKKLITIALISMIFQTAKAQKFYTNNFTKEVSELNTTLKNVGFIAKLPEGYKSYDDIVAVIDDKNVGIIDDFYTLNFYYNLTPVSKVPSSGSIQYTIYSQSSKSDFSSLFRTDMDEAYDLFYNKNFPTRTYRYRTVVVKIMGRKKDGMHWVNNEYVPKYNYTELSFDEIKLDLGEPKPTFNSTNGLFTSNKYSGGDYRTKVILDEETDGFEIVYKYKEKGDNAVKFSVSLIEAGEVQTETFDMSGSAPSSSKNTSIPEMIKEIKLNMQKSLIKSSCYNEARSVKLSGQRLACSKVSEGIYGPYMLDASKGKSSGGGFNDLDAIAKQWINQGSGAQGGKYEKFLKDPKNDLPWKTVTIGGVEMESVELDLYAYSQVISNSSNQTQVIKPEEEGKTQKVFVFIGEVKGKLFQMIFEKESREEMNEEDLKFKDYIVSKLQVN